MSWLLIRAFLPMVEATESPTLARAKELLDLIAGPTTIASVVLVGYARRQLDLISAKYDKSRARWGLLASFGAFVIAAVIVSVMTPLAYRSLIINRGRVETLLLVYSLTYLVACGTALYCVTAGWDCFRSGGKAGLSRRN
jgi:hypothetical protein